MNLLMRGAKKVPYQEQIFDLLHKSHIERTGHGGRDIMRHDLKEFSGLGEYPSRRFSKLFNIYLKFCEECELKRSRIRKSIVVKPILEKDFNKRMQVDLIDMQAQKSGESLN